MSANKDLHERDLHALVDGELDENAQAQAILWLIERPDLSARVEAWRKQNQAIENLYPSSRVGRAPIAAPRRAQPVQDISPDKEPPADPPIPFPHKAVFGFILTFAPAALFLVALFVLTPPAVLHPTEREATFQPAPKSTPALSLTIAAWRLFAHDDQQNLEMAAHPPARRRAYLKRFDLTDAPPIPGARFLGLRLFPAMEGPLAFFLFDAGDNQRLVLTATRSAGEPNFQTMEFADFRAVSWRYGDYDWAMAGEAPKSKFAALTQAVRTAQESAKIDPPAADGNELP